SRSGNAFDHLRAEDEIPFKILKFWLKKYLKLLQPLCGLVNIARSSWSSLTVSNIESALKLSRDASCHLIHSFGRQNNLNGL
ncbi:unnamed protein product, partial [Hymenolepis diminuta]